MEETTAPSTASPASTKPRAARPAHKPLSQNVSVWAVQVVERFWSQCTTENLISFLKTLIWVIPLTLMIWVYAEQEEEITVSDFAVPIEVKSIDPSRSVRLVNSGDSPIMCDISGTPAAIDKLRSMMANPANNKVIIPIDSSASLGEITLPTIQSIQQPDERFKNVTISKPQPAEIKVDVDEMVEVRDVPVEYSHDLPLRNATFSPKTVTVRAPRQILKNLPTVNGQISVIADVTGQSVLSVPGLHPPITVDVHLAGDSSLNGESVTITPPQVRATLDVKEQDVEGKIPTVPVFILASSAVTDHTQVKYDPTVLANVPVEGPPDQIERLMRLEVRPIAALEITTDDVRDSRTSKPVTILNLPDGVSLAKGFQPVVNYTLTDRQ